MNIRQIAKIKPGQDGAIWKNFLFRLDTLGNCFVYDMNSIKNSDDELEILSHFVLDKADMIVPHSNSVVFGCEYFLESDEFPLLYCNIYNNYSNAEDKLKGTCCVYRITRNQNSFTSELVQRIKIGFVEDSNLWCSENKKDSRPYGNFVIDREKGLYYAFTMIDHLSITRYFSFKLPKLSEGAYDDKFKVKTVTLSDKDIESFFDCEYHRFIQGACAHNGKIYSLEGFFHGDENEPKIRIIAPEAKTQEFSAEFASFGLEKDPEFIDFKDGICHYGDAEGNLYIIEF